VPNRITHLSHLTISPFTNRHRQDRQTLVFSFTLPARPASVMKIHYGGLRSTAVDDDPTGQPV
jgi:hypothetical protein